MVRNNGKKISVYTILPQCVFLYKIGIASVGCGFAGGFGFYLGCGGFVLFTSERGHLRSVTLYLFGNSALVLVILKHLREIVVSLLNYLLNPLAENFISLIVSLLIRSVVRNVINAAATFVQHLLGFKFLTCHAELGPETKMLEQLSLDDT